MGLARAETHLTPYDVVASRKYDKAREPDPYDAEKPCDDDDLSKEEKAELGIARYCLRLLADGVEARRPWETFDEAWDTLNGVLFPAKYPAWKSRIVINKIRALILFVQAVMTDNKPRVTVDPVVPGSEEGATILRKLSERDWEENGMQEKLSLSILYGLIWGTGILKIWYDPHADNGQGKHMASAVVPYRLYTNRTCTSINDPSCEYVVQIEDVSMGWIRRNFPDRASLVEEYGGSRLTTAKGRVTRDLILEGTEGGTGEFDNPIRTSINPPYITAPSEMRKPGESWNDDTIEYGEFWYRDDTMDDYERHVIVDGVPQMEAALDEHDLPIRDPIGFTILASPIDGVPFPSAVYKTRMVPKMETAKRMRYPNGRLTQMAGPIVLRDIPNPFQIDGFPYAEWKCTDFGVFWGQGFPLVLKDIAVGIVRMVSQGYDIMDRMGNPTFKYKKGMGLNVNSLKNKPGQLIPLDELNALELLPGAQIPNGFLELVTMLKQFMGEVAAIQDSVMGALQGGNTSFATIDQLQESGAAPIRMMVRNMEKMLKRAGTLRIQLFQQFDEGKRPLRETTEHPPQVFRDAETQEVIDVVHPPSEQTITFLKYAREQLQGVVEYGVVPDSSLSSSPAGMWNRYATMYDKHLIDQQAFLEKFQIDDWRKILDRMRAAQMAAAQAKGKPGPAPSRPPRSGARPKNQKSNVPSRLQNNAAR